MNISTFWIRNVTRILPSENYFIQKCSVKNALLPVKLTWSFAIFFPIASLFDECLSMLLKRPRFGFQTHPLWSDRSQNDWVGWVCLLTISMFESCSACYRPHTTIHGSHDPERVCDYVYGVCAHLHIFVHACVTMYDSLSHWTNPITTMQYE